MTFVDKKIRMWTTCPQLNLCMDYTKLWKSVLAEIELSVSKATFQTQFSHTTLASFANSVATIGVPNPLIRSMIEGRYYSLIKSVLDQRTGENVSVVFVISPPKKVAPDEAGPLFAQQHNVPAVDQSLVARSLHVRQDATFENFAVSTANQMAYAAATAVAKNPGSAYNPLFFYGGTGVGKTHLMHAVANDMLSRRVGAKIVYCMGEEFLNEIVEAIQTKTSRQFKQKYRSAELLLVDDVQFIAGKTTAQEEFFHTFNAVHREGGQIILTSDRPPGEIAKLEDRLRSRFEGGLAVDIAPPDFELRAAIINIKSAAAGLSVPPDAAQLIAANITDTRAIEGFLKRLSSEAATKKAPISAEMVASLLSLKRQPGNGEGAGQKPRPRASVQDALEAVASAFGTKPTTLKGPKRDRPIARPRQVFMYLCRVELGLTFDDIGAALSGRDHTTVMHGVETITRELSTNMGLREAVEGIKRKLWA